VLCRSAAIEAAVKAGVGHVVYTSMPRPEGSPILIAPDHAATEAALKASALTGWTVLRNYWYFENLLMSLPHVVATGQWFTAAGDGKIASIARDDLARAAAVALATSTGGKTTLTLGGDKPRTTAEIAALVSEATGKPIQVIQVSVEDLVKGMVGAGLPEPVARLIASFDVNTAAGRAGDVTGDFKSLTGVNPLPFEQWLATNRAALTPRPAAG
jgi:NAD(P)H dehydrogenase (quinone)